MSKGKIMWLSDSPLTVTGYATITRNVLNGLSRMGWECVQLAHNYPGQTLPANGVVFKDGTRIEYELVGSGMQGYCADVMEARCREYKPDIFCVLLDTFMLYPWILDKDLSPAKAVFYFPTDGGKDTNESSGLPLGCELILQRMNKNIAMARFGQRQVKACHKIDVDYIPHAVDTQLYRPLNQQERLELRRKWGLIGKFVVGCVARNQGRKMLDRELKAFAQFAKSHPDAVLFLHTDPDDAAQTFNMRALVTRLGIENRVRYTGMQFFKGTEYRQMNEIYNLMDVFFLSTSGEGFGIPIIEAMSCGVPPIVTDYTTTKELLEEDGLCGWLVRDPWELTGSWNVERGIMNIPEAVKCLEDSYQHPELRVQYAIVGRNKVLQLYSWEVILKAWDQYFTEMMR